MEAKQLAGAASMRAALAVVLVGAFSLASSPTSQKAARGARTLENDRDKVSYAVGLNLGNQLRQLSMDVDADLIADGFRDAMSGGRPLLTDREVRLALGSLQAQMKRNQAARHASRTLKPGKEGGGIALSFKLDPRLTSGLYMGERWVSPPTYTRAAEGTLVMVDARAHRLDARRRPIPISPTWTPADPRHLTVTPSEGHQVRITVNGEGESILRVTFQGVSKELTVKAAQIGRALQVEIAQEP